MLIYCAKFLESTRTEPAACRKYLKRNSCHFRVERSERNQEIRQGTLTMWKMEIWPKPPVESFIWKEEYNHSNKHAHKKHPKPLQIRKMQIVTEKQFSMLPKLVNVNVNPIQLRNNLTK